MKAIRNARSVFSIALISFSLIPSIQGQPLWSYASATKYARVSSHSEKLADDDFKAKGMLRLDQAEAVIVRLCPFPSDDHHA